MRDREREKEKEKHKEKEREREKKQKECRGPLSHTETGRIGRATRARGLLAP